MNSLPSPVDTPWSVPEESTCFFCYDPVLGPRFFPTMSDLVGEAKRRAASGNTNVTWVDVESTDESRCRRLFDDLHAITPSAMVEIPTAVQDAVLRPWESDVVQLEASSDGYAYGVLSCASVDGPTPNNELPTGEAYRNNLAEQLDAASGFVWCSFFATPHLLLTVHARPFVGLQEVARSLDMNYSLAAMQQRFTCGVALATLAAYTSETMLPDPTALLSEVDCIDEMVLLIAPGQRDQPDLLRRVALLRRRISSYRARLYLKEKLLNEFVSPSMRGSFIGGGVKGNSQEIQAATKVTVAVLYRNALEKVTQVADRLDEARDVLNQANLNFVTGVSMRMSQSSANMDFKMQLLGQVATICLPLNLVASIFGMNCTVPWQTDTHPTLTAFGCIIGLMVLWCVGTSIPLVLDKIRGNKAKAIVPTE